MTACPVDNGWESVPAADLDAADLGRALRDLLGGYTPDADPYLRVARRIRARRRSARLAGLGLAAAAVLLVGLAGAARCPPASRAVRVVTGRGIDARRQDQTIGP